MVPGGRMNAGRFIQFLKRILAGSSAEFSGSSMPPVTTPKGSPTSSQPALRGRIANTLPYSLDLNPDETVWKELKNR